MSELNLAEYEICNYVYGRGCIAKKGDRYGALSPNKDRIILDFKYREFSDAFYILNGNTIRLPQELSELDDILYINNDDRIRYRDMLAEGTSPESIIENAKTLVEIRLEAISTFQQEYYKIAYVNEMLYYELKHDILHASTKEEVDNLLKKAAEINSFCTFKLDIYHKIRDFLALSSSETSSFYHQIILAKSKEETYEIYSKAKALAHSRSDDYTEFMENRSNKKNSENDSTSPKDDSSIEALPEKRFGYTDDLYQFLLDALIHDDLLNAFDIVKDCGCSTEEISKTAIKLLESYEDLDKVENLSDIWLDPLVTATRNFEFVKQLQIDLETNYRQYIATIEENFFEQGFGCIEDPIARAKFKLFENNYFSNFYSNLVDVVSWTIRGREEESLKRADTLELYLGKYACLEIEKIRSLIFNDWCSTDLFGNPTAEEIVWTTLSVDHPGLHKYVLRNYKDILQSNWHDADSTEWNYLKRQNQRNASDRSKILVNYYLERQGLALTDDGELISLEDQKPVQLDIDFPPASDVTKDHWWVSEYEYGMEFLTKILKDWTNCLYWTNNLYSNKAHELAKFRLQVSKIGHPGIMRFVLKKYQEELQECIPYDKSLYDLLCEDIARVEENPEDYEHLTRLYDKILADESISYLLPEELKSHFSK